MFGCRPTTQDIAVCSDTFLIMPQALDRTGGKVGNKGAEAALTAIETATLLEGLYKQEKAAKYQERKPAQIHV